MIVLEMKAVVKPSQCSAIDEAIRTVQFIIPTKKLSNVYQSPCL